MIPDNTFELIYKGDKVIAMKQGNDYYPMFDVYHNEWLHKRYHELISENKDGQYDGT